MDPMLSGGQGTITDSTAIETGSQLTSYSDGKQYQQFRGNVPVQQGNYTLSKSDDPDYKKPVVRHMIKARVFDLADTEAESKTGLEAYNLVLQEIYDGKDGAEFVSCVVHEPCAGAPTWSAYVQWRTKMIMPANMQGSEQYRPQVRG